MLQAILIGLGMIALMLIAFRVYRGEEFVHHTEDGHFAGLSPFAGIKDSDVVISIVLGVLVGIADYIPMKLEANAVGVAWISVGLAVIMAFAILCWSLTGWGLLASAVSIGMYILLYRVAMSSVLVAAAWFSDPWYIFCQKMVLAILIFAITLELMNLVFYKYRNTQDGMSAVYGGLTFVVLLAGIAAMVFLVVIPIVQGFKAAPEPEPQPEPEPEPIVYEWDLQNPKVQHDGRADNDYNFGPTPSGQWPDEAVDLSGYTVTNEAAPYLATLLVEMAKDPVKGVGIIAAHDKLLNEDTLGFVWYDDEDLNNIVDWYLVHPYEYWATMDEFFKEVQFRGFVERRWYEQGTLISQMYQNPYTDDGVPDLVVAESYDRGGWALVITYANDGEELILREECDFQPCNLEKVPVGPNPYGPTPQPTTPQPETTTPQPETTTPQPETTTPQPETTTPQPETTTPQPETTTPQPETTTPQPETTTPQPTEPETTTLHKDKADGTQGDLVKPNDNPGPGEDTNDGVGAQYSTKDQPQNSNHMASYEAYTQAIQELQQINEVQKTGNDDNTPSYIPPATAAEGGVAVGATEPATVKVDNNGDTGNGGAPINTVTPVQAPAVAADTGQAISTQPAGEWGGPPD